MIYVNANGDVAMVSNGVQISGSGVVGKNQDNHFALTREGTTERLFVNGNLIGTATGRNNDYNRDRLHLGSSAPNGEGSSGYYNDLRVYKGVAKYTSSFKVGSPNPTVVPDTPSGVSGGSKLTKITDGAVAFDGSGDYLSVTGPGTLAASSNWCMECFFYCAGNASGTYRIMSANESAQSSEYILMRIRLGQYQWSTDNANSQPIDTAAFNKWTHMAFTKEGTTVRGFIDGKKIWEATDNNTVTITELITGWGYGGEYFPGHISNARFVNGSSVYTADFTPPPAPLTNITNTYLLCCQSNTQPGTAAVSPNVSGSINTGTQWSFYGDTTAINSSYPWTKAFDGVTDGTYGNGAGATDGAGWARWTPGITITVSTQLRINTDNGSTSAVKVKFVGSTVQHLTSLSDGWNVVSGTGTLEYIEIYNSGTTWSYLCGVEVDSTVLKDPLSPNGNAAATNFTPFNTDINTVRGQETVYPTLNPLDKRASTVLSNGNLTVTGAGSCMVFGKKHSICLYRQVLLGI